MKSRRFYSKGGGRARSTGKSIDELNKVTPCNRCGAIGHWEEDCTQPARSRKKRSPSAKGRGKSRRKYDGKGRGVSNYPIVEENNDGSKIHASNLKVVLGCAVSDCGAARVCVEQNRLLRWHRHVHEKGSELEMSGSLRQSMRVIISVQAEIILSVHS